MKKTDAEKKQLFENIIINNWNAIVFANMEGIVVYVNPAANKLYGYEGDELIGKNVDIFNSRITHNTEDIVNSIINTGSWTGELIQRKKDDTHFEALLSVQLINDKDGNPIGYASNSKDISEDKETRKKLRQIIKEKEILLGELHHRVKNNLNLIQSILRIQINTSDDVEEQGFLKDYLNRISAIGDLHNTIYKSENLDHVSLKDYISELSSNVVSSFDNESVKLSLDLEDCQSNLSNVVPVGLIVNEVITNSFKHGFKEVSNPELSITLLPKKDRVYIKIKDNGKGFDYSKLKNKSMGMWLIKELCEQIDAKFNFENSDGTVFNLNYEK